MFQEFADNTIHRGTLRLPLRAAALIAYVLCAGCATLEWPLQNPKPASGSLSAPETLDPAAHDGQRTLAYEKPPPDIALYNMGVVSVHSANLKPDYPRALRSFTSLVNNYPASSRAEEAKIWIQTLKQIQRNNDELRKLAEEKRALSRERDQLAHERDQLTEERNKLKSEIEKSRKLDAEIEKRRRRSLKR